MRLIRYTMCGTSIVFLAACGVPTGSDSADVAARTGDQRAADQARAAPSAEPSIAADAVPTRLALPSVAPLAPNAEQQAAMGDPQELVRYWADQVQRQQYENVEPLLTDSLRQAFAAQQPGGVPAYYSDQAQQRGALSGATILGQRTPYDSDTLLIVDTDLQYAQGAVQLELDVTQTNAGWKIDNFGTRSDKPLPSIELTDEMRANLQEPERAARFFADLLQGQQYGQLAPIFTYYARQTAPGSIEQLYVDQARQLGKLESYAIVDGRARQENGDQFYEIDADLRYERQASNVKIVLAQTPQGWKINHTVPRQ